MPFSADVVSVVVWLRQSFAALEVWIRQEAMLLRKVLEAIAVQDCWDEAQALIVFCTCVLARHAEVCAERMEAEAS